MLSPSELRDEAKCERRHWKHKEEQGIPGNPHCLVIADLCEQVAELREQCDPYHSAFLDSKPQPRILKAHQITENGFYLSRPSGGSWREAELLEVRREPGRLRLCQSDLMEVYTHEYDEFYGPIPLPE